MSGIITPSGLVNELTVITDPDTLSEVNVPGETVNRKIKKSVDKTYFQGTLPAEVAQVASDLEDAEDGTSQLNPRSFTSGRFDSQELTSGSLSVSGWYTITETDATSSEQPLQAKFNCSVSGSGRRNNISFNVNVTTSGSAITDKNHIEITGRSSYTSSYNAPSIRLVYSNISTGGIKIQIYLDISSTITLISQISNMIAHTSASNLELVTPYLDNTPTLPDGVTVGTFLEAGEELSFENETSGILGVRKISNDICQISVILPEIPKQGTGITISLPSTSLLFHDGSGTSVTITGAHSTSNFTITRQIITFRITEVAKFTTLNSGPLQATWNGTGGKLTIT